ncbi:MAG: YlaH-like family protein [Bacilli bacterium]
MEVNVVDRMYFFARLYRVHEQPELGQWFMFGTIVVLCIVVYQLGFAKKLPLLKNMIVYVALFFGSTILTLLSTFLPIAEGLVGALIVLLLYRIRHRMRSETNDAT